MENPASHKILLARCLSASKRARVETFDSTQMARKTICLRHLRQLRILAITDTATFA